MQLVARSHGRFVAWRFIHWLSSVPIVTRHVDHILYCRWTHIVLTRRHIREREGREALWEVKKMDRRITSLFNIRYRYANLTTYFVPYSYSTPKIIFGLLQIRSIITLWIEYLTKWARVGFMLWMFKTIQINVFGCLVVDTSSGARVIIVEFKNHHQEV